jgi:hypothetical protein
MRSTLSRVRYVVDVDQLGVNDQRKCYNVTRWQWVGVNLGGVSLEALALPPLYLVARPRISRMLKQKSPLLPSVLGRMPLLWASPCVASALEAAEHVGV